MTDRIGQIDHLGIKRFFNLDGSAYKDGALDGKTKELLGLVASAVLRCNDCIDYHLTQCVDAGWKDEELYDAILFTLGTTNGFFIANSTPWSRDHIFYRICKDKEFEDFSRDHHVTWEQALEPNGPLIRGILEKIRKQLANDPWRWRREMEAEWSEDDDCWLPTSLITECTDSQLEIREFGGELRSFWATNLGTDLPR